MRWVRLGLGWLWRKLHEEDAPTERQWLPHCRLYEFTVCPYCARVRRAMVQFGIGLERVDIDRDAAARRELAREGGKAQVPCLRISEPGCVRWLYESSAIVAYLRQEART